MLEEKATSHFVDVVFVQSTAAIDSVGSPDLLLSTLLTMWKEEGIRRRLWFVKRHNGPKGCMLSPK